MDVSLCFDTEDYTSPPEWGMDDIPKWLSEIMTEEGVTGTFLVIGHKARAIHRRKRKDVLAAMRKHEIGLHTNFGSDHPTLVEALAPLDWHEAVKLADERETPGFVELSEIIETNIGTASTHGASQAAPMHYIAGLKWDRPWLYSFVPCPPENFCWYTNCFQFGFKGIAISESAYSQPPQVDATLARWEKEVEALVASGAKWCYVFLAHPLMIRCKQFNDALNFADGKNRWPWRTPEMRTLEEMEIAKQQFRRVVRWIAKHPKLRVRTLYDTFRAFAKRKVKIRRDELAAYVERAVRHQTILTGYTFSPAEALHAVCEGMVAERFPPASPVVPALGPLTESMRMPDNALAWLGAGELKALAHGVLEHVRMSGHLPSALPAPNGAGRMGLPTLFHTLTEAWLLRNAGRKDFVVRVAHICNRYPKDADLVEASARKRWLNWPIHDIHLPLENLSRHARLMSWTWKTVYVGDDAPQAGESAIAAAVKPARKSTKRARK